eukprot:SM000267S09860  [mRNA]  locus=s267:34566:36968:- [translate_table: standard]
MAVAATAAGAAAPPLPCRDTARATAPARRLRHGVHSLQLPVELVICRRPGVLTTKAASRAASPSAAQALPNIVASATATPSPQQPQAIQHMTSAPQQIASRAGVRLLVTLALLQQGLLSAAPAMAAEADGHTEEEWIQIFIVWAVVGFGYLFICPPIILNVLRLRWFKRSTLETYFQFMAVFLFFPAGVLLGLGQDLAGPLHASGKHVADGAGRSWGPKLGSQQSAVFTFHGELECVEVAPVAAALHMRRWCAS